MNNEQLNIVCEQLQEWINDTKQGLYQCALIRTPERGYSIDKIAIAAVEADILSSYYDKLSSLLKYIESNKAVI